MSCACSKTRSVLYEWTDGTNVVIYTSLMAAKAKVLRTGGTYKIKEA